MVVLNLILKSPHPKLGMEATETPFKGCQNLDNKDMDKGNLAC
jgi:hypothetical protein